MAIIEGVGDEVTILFGIVFLVLVLVLAWVSTQTADRSDQLFTSMVSTATYPSAEPESTEVTQAGGEVQDENVNEPQMIVEQNKENTENAAVDETASSSNEQTATEPENKTSVPNSDGLRQRTACSPFASSNSSSNNGRLESQEPETSEAASQPPPNDFDGRGMVLRLKFLNDTEKLARVKLDDTIGYLKRTYFPGQEHQVRLIYQGQLLREDSQTLASLHLTDNCVLHCHISQHATPQMPAGTHAADQVNTALNIGSLMVPLFVLMLAVLWYFQIQYRQFFTATATFSLVGITIFFSFMAFAVYRR
ncbi:transmembrane and ubiquitin-like domain-containing protein 1 [Latimeria chalumnae]|uniref:Transmembrane and ubiquitin-like domain-containing protein 1 n=1 Tax=Latimeria chalumnae TaxID=7897 RepID=H3AM98_LATCH|nr:PREDICTED: transmembrane and ubiquitin-like domain-containing protein 1 [Latimeria chalumnae]XP_014342848.1 PREDICTED: transmembrane and ubiquitin-like domain-containing protein 1 [Latimeria chalumnae]|eukprot:XP_005994276.1 PREDICTED: transmembrane and ubiquitin-like domain-containing protein 1 [Latimeria chalumnae]